MGALFAPNITQIAAEQTDPRGDDSWYADPREAAQVREEVRKLGALVRWDQAIRAHRATIRARRKQEDEEDRKLREGMIDPKPLEVPDDGDTAIEYASYGNAELAEMLTRMNAEHAVVPFANGSVRYLHKVQNYHGKHEQRFLRPDDFHRLYSHISFNVNGKKVTASQAWERWSHRKQYTGVGMFPGSPKHPAQVPRGHLNLWKGFSIEPKKGDWNLFKAHLLEKVCQNKRSHCDFLLDWLAHLLQKPQEKPGTCVVLRSKAEGTGKSILADFLRNILGEHVLSVSKPNQIVGNFNGHLLKTVLLVCEEAIWAGSKEAEGALKDLITGGHITIEQKGQDPFSAPNFSRLMLLSNNDWVVPVGADPRRYFVLEVVNDRANDPTYFDPLLQQMKSGGLAAMLEELLQRDISKSNLRFAPATDALRDQRRQSLSSAERFVLEIAEAGSVPGEDDDRTELKATKEVLVSCHQVTAAAKRSCGHSEVRGLDRSLGQLLKAIGVERVRTRLPAGKLAWSYAFPPWGQLCDAVGQQLKVEIEGHAETLAGSTIH